MNEMSPNRTMPSSMHTNTSPTFQDVFNAALIEYTNQTETHVTDLANRPLAAKIENCKSANDLLLVLEEQAKVFREFREGNKRLMKTLEPTVNVLYTLSLAFGDGIGLVRPLQLTSLGSISPYSHFRRLSHLNWQSSAVLVSSLWSVSPSLSVLYFSFDNKVYC